MLQNHATLQQIRFHLLSELRQIYTENESDSITRLIMEHIGFPLERALRDPGHVPATAVNDQINRIIANMQGGMPIQYALGYAFFCDLKIEVDRRVLIPRPETEALVEYIKVAHDPGVRRVIDLGTGSGCIALALKKYFPDDEVWGADISIEALHVAEKNGRLNHMQVRWEKLDLLSHQPGEHLPLFDLVVSNPPYVLNRERHEMAGHVKDFEPGTALFVDDEDPLVFYRAIGEFCNRHLSEKGEIWVEINEQFGEETARLFEREGFGRTRIIRDIHDKERYINASR